MSAPVYAPKPATKVSPRIADGVRMLRNTPVAGTLIDLVPYSSLHHDTIISLRNTERATYFLHQPEPLTLAKQAQWFDSYLKRTDDIQWAIVEKSGKTIGATALYGISDDFSRAEKGRLVADELASQSGPLVLEAELLLLDTAFFVLGLDRVETCVRHDNTVMQSINSRFGFTATGQHDIRGVTYFDFALLRDHYKPSHLRSTVETWANRMMHRSSRP